MKKTYAFIVAGAMLMSGGLVSCTGENTTGVDTETTANEVDGRLNDPEGGAVTQDNISPMDTADNPGADTTLNSTTPRTTTPTTDNGF